MWDIKEYEERIKNPRGDHRDKDLFIVRAKRSFFLKDKIHRKLFFRLAWF